MAVSLELINSTVADLDKRVESAFLRSNPFVTQLQKKSRVDTASRGGSYIEESIFGGSPAKGVGLFVGDEQATLTRLQKTKKYSTEYHAVLIPISIPGKEVRQNSGDRAAFNLIEEYPKNVLDGFLMDWNKYLLTGVSEGQSLDTAEMLGFTTLNGDFASGIGQGVTNGLLDFATPATQTDTVQNVAKSNTYAHYNQYEDITTNWATDGYRLLSKLYRACAQYSGQPGKGPDLIVMDDGTFGNFELERKDQIRLKAITDKIDTGNDGLEQSFRNAMVYSDLALDLSAFSGTGVDGVAYVLNTSFFKLSALQLPKISKFVDQLEDQDAFTSKLLAHMQLTCRRFPAQGVLSGGNT